MKVFIKEKAWINRYHIIVWYDRYGRVRGFSDGISKEDHGLWMILK